MRAKARRLPKKIASKSKPIPPNCTLEREYVLCGKAGCARRHGPYWYAYWKEGTRMRKRYVGSNEALARLIESWGERARREVYDEEIEQDRKDSYGGELAAKGPGSRPRRPWARGGRWAPAGR